MDDEGVTVIELPDRGDARGSSFGVPAAVLADPFPVADLHLCTIVPGAVRGNHHHAARREILLVMAEDRWSLHWDAGPGTPIRQRTFSGPGAVLVKIPIGMAHAVRNDGASAVRIVGLTDGPFDPDQPDSFPRPVITKR